VLQPNDFGKKGEKEKVYKFKRHFMVLNKHLELGITK